MWVLPLGALHAPAGIPENQGPCDTTVYHPLPALPELADELQVRAALPVAHHLICITDLEKARNRGCPCRLANSI